MTKRHLEGTKGQEGHEGIKGPRTPLIVVFVCVVLPFVLFVVSFDAREAADVFKAQGGDVTVTPFLHASVQLEHAGKVIQVDPWSVADLSGAKPADLILVTDDPGHHLDVKAIAALRKPGAPVVIAANGLKRMPDGIVMKNGEQREVAGILVEAVAAYDLTPGEPYHPKGEANGYIVTVGGLRVYFAGVTECVPEIRAVKGVDVAFFPMNLPLQRMEPEAAADCLRSFRPRVVYPYHYDQEWVTRVTRGEPGGTPTTRGLEPLKAALARDGIEVRLTGWYR